MVEQKLYRRKNVIVSFTVVVKDELELILQHHDIKRRRVPILFFANKTDCVDSLSSVKIAGLSFISISRIISLEYFLSLSLSFSGSKFGEN